MKLQWLPDAGAAPWLETTSYAVVDTEWFEDFVVVLGQLLRRGVHHAYFIAVYTYEGEHHSGSAHSTRSFERAREIFDVYVAGRRRECREREEAVA